MKVHEEGAHWSKDFVEHLRTVHFSLIAVSVGLIALALAHPIGPLEKALKQLREINNVTAPSKSRFQVVGENHSDWVGEWAEAQVRRAIAAQQISTTVPVEQIIRSHGEVISPNVWCNIENSESEYYLNQYWILIQPSDGEKLNPAFLRTELPTEGAVVETASLGLSQDMKLDDFKRLWDFLHQQMDIVVPISRGSKVFLWDAKQARWNEYQCKDAGASSRTIFLNIGLLSDRERWSKLAPRVGDEPPRYGYVSNDNSAFISLDQFNGVNFNGQGWFLSKIPAWTSGKFAESFPELDQLSVGTSNQDLDTVKRVLENKPNESADVFEFSGIKIPSEVVMRFGILLVIGVQIYFLTHLIELSKRLRASDPGWEVAWIGVYEHVLARIVYFCTIVILPAVSIAALGRRGLTQFSPTQNWATVRVAGITVDILNWGILVTGIALELGLAFWIWRKTPRSSMESRLHS